MAGPKPGHFALAGAWFASGGGRGVGGSHGCSDGSVQCGCICGLGGGFGVGAGAGVCQGPVQTEAAVSSVVGFGGVFCLGIGQGCIDGGAALGGAPCGGRSQLAGSGGWLCGHHQDVLAGDGAEQVAAASPPSVLILDGWLIYGC